MRIWFISDTHGSHSKLSIPDYDIVCHCGDFSNSKNWAINLNESLEFLDWYGDLPGDKILISGNHDTYSARENYLFREECKSRNITYLLNEMAIVQGIRFWGSPYTPSYGEWAFMKKRNSIEIVWDLIEPCDVLLTHGPPKGVLDLAWDENDRNRIVQVGCKSLLNKVLDVKPKIHAFGHIHSDKKFNNFGNFKGKYSTIFVNAACSEFGTRHFNNGVLHDLQISCND